MAGEEVTSEMTVQNADIKREVSPEVADEKADAKPNSDKKRKNPIVELIDRMKEKRAVLLERIEAIKELRKKYKGMSQTSVKALKRKKERLEFKIATEAITLDKERALMKSIKNLDSMISQMEAKENERKELKHKIKELDAEIEDLKNSLDEMKLELMKLKEERKARRVKRKERMQKKQPKTKQELQKDVNEGFTLEDIAVIKKK